MIGLKRPVWFLALAFLAAAGCSKSNKKDGIACDPGQANNCPDGQVCAASGICVDDPDVLGGKRANCEFTACGCKPEPGCLDSPQGPRFGVPFAPDMTNSDGVGVNPDGGLVLSSKETRNQFIWISNTNQGTISKISTVRKDANGRYVEEGRYSTGPRSDYGCYGAAPYTGLCSNFTGVDPSRTTVNGAGDVFVGNRHDGSVTKIASDATTCPDRNVDGMVRTSTGATDILPWTADDCVVWRNEVNTAAVYVRAMAAQDVEGPDGVVRSYVWVGDSHLVAPGAAGGSTPGTIWKLDGATGQVLVTTRINKCSPYGFAFDKGGNLWVSCSTTAGNPGGIGRLATAQCTDAGCVTASTCETQGGACDTAVKQFIALGSNPYGVTVDFKQRVWLGVYQGGPIVRYDPQAAAGSRIAPINDSGDVLGVTATANGTVYAARHTTDSVWKINGDTLAKSSISVAPAGVTSTRGMAVDFSGMIWVVSDQQATAAVIDPNTDAVSNAVNNLVAPYVYSDMTGTQLRLATNPTGTYRHVFEGCSQGRQSWKRLVWDADVPDRTGLTWLVRTSDSLQSINDGSAPQVRVAAVPPDSSPADIAKALSDAGVTPGRYLELTIRFKSEPRVNELLTPVVRSFDVSHECVGTLI